MRFNRFFALTLAGLAVILSGVIFYFVSIPRLIAFLPQSGAVGVNPAELLRLEFSRPMDLQSVSSRLQIWPDAPVRVTTEGNSILVAPQTMWLSGQVITVTLEAGASSAGFPGLSVRESTTWRFQVRPVMLAYLWPTDGPADIYALTPDSGQIIRLTQDAGVRDYQITVDGHWVYYTTDTAERGSQILRIPWKTEQDKLSAAEIIYDCAKAVCRSVQVSPDGSYLAFERSPFGAASDDAAVSVWILELASGQSRPVGPPDEQTRSPRWTVQDRLAVYNSSRKAYQVYPAAGGSPVELPNQVGDSGDWQPDGTAFVASEFFEEVQNLLETTSSGHLMRYSLETTGEVTDLTQANNIEDTSPVFSPDGRLLAFARKYLVPPRWTAGRQLYWMDFDQRVAHALTDDPIYTYFDFAWSPDSRRIAAVRFNQVALTEPAELWLFYLDGSEPLQLVIGGFAPQWAP